VTALRRSLLLWALAAAAAPASADVVVTLLDSAEPVRGISLAASDKTITVHQARGPVVRIAARKVIQILVVPQPPAPAASTRPFELELAGGSRLRGMLRGGSEDKLRLQSAMLGESGGSLEIDLEQLRGVRRVDGTPVPGASRLVRIPDKDAAYRLSGARVEGFVGRFGATGVEIQRGRLRPVQIPYGELAGIFLDTDPLPPPKGLYAVVRLVDGSRLVLSRGFRVDGGVVAGTTPGGLLVRVARNRVAAIGFRGGASAHLSDLPPAEVKREPFFPLAEGPLRPAMLEFVCPVRFDLSPDGRPIRLAGIHYYKGIGVRPRTALTYRLDGSFTAFEALCGIDDEVLGPGYGRGAGTGSVVFKVLVDGRTAYSSEPVRGGRKPIHVRVALDGAKSLTLVVDWVPKAKLAGGTADSPELDNAVWARPLLIR